jgi:hypothetical protein
MRARFAALGVIGAMVLWAAVYAQQTQPRPGPGSGIMAVEGTVAIGNIPTVNATVTNTPSVQVTSVPPVGLAPLPFVRVGARYAITWPNGESQRVTIASVGPHGWVNVGQESWVNLAAARSIQPAQ